MDLGSAVHFRQTSLLPAYNFAARVQQRQPSRLRRAHQVRCFFKAFRGEQNKVSASNSEVLQRPAKEELSPKDVKNVFSYRNELRKRCSYILKAHSGPFTGLTISKLKTAIRFVDLLLWLLRHPNLLLVKLWKTSDCTGMTWARC